jgi:hypothetical protein
MVESGAVPGEPAGRGPRIGGREDVAWINSATSVGVTIAAAIPSIFARYATVVVPDDVKEKSRSDAALVQALSAHTPPQPWWLGYLDTGVADLVVRDAARVAIYTGWPYVLLEAGPQEALTWRDPAGATPWHSALPELLFPADRSWLVSTLWDDDWRCLGGSAALIAALLGSPFLDARAVELGADATPPGHVAR